MDHNEFKLSVAQLSLTQVEIAKLLAVTTRSVNLWATGQTSIPGPVEAYLRIMKLIPQAYKDLELELIRKDQPVIKQGMYQAEFYGKEGSGSCTLVFEKGRVYGADTGKGKYDGSYFLDQNTGFIETKLKIIIPEGLNSVLGVPAQPMEWGFTVNVQFPNNPKDSEVYINTPYGSLRAIINFLRELPN